MAHRNDENETRNAIAGLRESKSLLNNNRRSKEPLIPWMRFPSEREGSTLLSLSICSRYPGLKKKDEKGKREWKAVRKGKGDGGGGEKGSELLRRPEADGGRAIAAGCSSSFFDLGLAY